MKTQSALLLLTLSLTAHADSNWDMMKDIAKEQAKQKAEQELNLPQPAPMGSRAYFIEPANGAEVKSPVKVVFGLAGMGVAPAGVNQQGTGHHHLLIDSPQVVFSQPLPANDQVRHFGGGHTETLLDLKPGKHTLQLVVGDWKHQAHNPAVMSETITITVVK